MDGHAANLVALQLQLAGVDGGAHLDPQLRRRAADLLRGPNGALGTVEASDEPVAGRRDLAPPEPIEEAAHRQVVPPQEVAPRSVAHRKGMCRRVDDVALLPPVS